MYKTAVARGKFMNLLQVCPLFESVKTITARINYTCTSFIRSAGALNYKATELVSKVLLFKLTLQCEFVQQAEYCITTLSARIGMPRKKEPFFPLQTDFTLKDKLCQRKAIQVCSGTLVVIGFKVAFIPVFRVVWEREPALISPGGKMTGFN